MEQSVQSGNLFDLQIDQQANYHLLETAKWAKFLSIVGFIMCGLLAMFALFAGSIFSAALSQMEEMGTAVGGTMLTIIYLAMALLWFFPFLYLYRFATKATIALRSADQQNLNQSFKNLKSCFRFLGIMTIIMLGMYALVFVVAIGAAMTM